MTGVMGMKQIKDTFFIVVGNMICSLGIGTIALRLGLSLGGVSGLSKVLHNVLPVSISILVLAVNLVLFALAYFLVGKKFAMNSFLSVILFPVFLEIAQSITVLDCLKEDLLLGTMIGGVLLGSGSGLILRGNGSSGGFDIIGVILNKYFNIKTASTMALIDVFVLVFQIRIENLMLSIYGVVMIFITSYMVNLILTKENNEVKIMIFSKKEDEIQDMLLHERDCGCSILHGETGYTKEKMCVIVSIMPYDKVNPVKQSILAIDQDAFIVLENVQAAYSGVHYLRKPEEL